MTAEQRLRELRVEQDRIVRQIARSEAFAKAASMLVRYSEDGEHATCVACGVTWNRPESIWDWCSSHKNGCPVASIEALARHEKRGGTP